MKNQVRDEVIAQELDENLGSDLESVDLDSRKELLSLIEDNSEDIMSKKKLEKNIRKTFRKLFGKMSSAEIAEMLDDPTIKQGDKKALIMLSENYYDDLSDVSVDYNNPESVRIYNEHKEAFERELNKAQRDLDFLMMEMDARISYRLDNLRSVVDGALDATDAAVDALGEEPSVGEGITDDEMDVLADIINGKDLLGERLSSDERKLRREFFNAIKLLKKKAENTLSLKTILRTFYNEGIQLRHGNPDWNTLLKKADGSDWDNSQIDTLNKGYDAFVNAHKGDANFYRWGLVIGSLERGVLSEGKSLTTVYTESLNQPITKRERKEGLRIAREEFEAQTPDKTEWINQYLINHQAEIQAKQHEWRAAGRTGPEIRSMTNDYLESRYKHRWDDYVREMEQYGVQEADLGKFRKLVGDLDSDTNKSRQDRLFALLTDTNFDGMRNHLDGQGTKRGLQVDQSLHTAIEHGKTPEEIMKNIADYIEGAFGFKIPGEPKTLEDFYKWMRSDILNAKRIQKALMDSPADALDIMTDGKNALRRTLEKRNGISQEVQEKVSAKLDTNPHIKELPEATREMIMSSVANHLHSKIEQRGANASENGLGVGIGVPLDQILNGLDFNLVAGTTLDGTPYVGVELAWNHNIVSWESGSINGGIRAGTNLGVIPVYGARLGFDQDTNLSQVLGDIDPHTLKEVNIGGNITMIGALPSWGLSVGYSADQMKGIDKQYNKLKKFITPILETSFREIGAEQDITKQKEIVKKWLKREYRNADETSLDQATENLVAAIRLALNSGLKPEEAITAIAEWYTESWRNNAINGLSTNWKVTGISLGVQFLAGFFPIATLGVTLTKYKNKSFVDDERSRQELRQKVDKGIGNETADFSTDSFQEISNQLREAGVLIEGEIVRLNPDNTVEFSTSLIDKPGFSVMIRKDLKNYVQEQEGLIKFPAGLAYRFLKSMGATGTTMVLNIGGDNNTGMEPLNSSTLSEFVGEGDYLTDQYLGKLRTDLEDLKQQDKWKDKLNGYEINDQGHLIHDGKDLGLIDRTHGIGITERGGEVIIVIIERIGIIINEDRLIIDDEGRFIDGGASDLIGNVDHIMDDGTTDLIVRIIRRKKKVRKPGNINSIGPYLSEKPLTQGDKIYVKAYGKNITFYPIACIKDGMRYSPDTGLIQIRTGADGEYIIRRATDDEIRKLKFTYIPQPGYYFDSLNSELSYDYIPSFLTELGGFYKNSREYKEAYLDAGKEVLKILRGERGCEDVVKGLEVITVDGVEQFKNPELAYQIIDRLKAVFATIDDSQKNSKSSIDNLVGDRDRRWRGNHGGKGVIESFSEGSIKLDYTHITDSLGNDFSQKLIPNLIGFTAFYRSRLQQDAKGLSLTPIGQTRVLGGTVDVPEDQSAGVIERIKGNMERIAGGAQGDLISHMIGQIDGQYIGKDKIPSLLRDGQVNVGDKIVHIEYKPVMYLLAECGNESIGLELTSISVENPTTGAYEEVPTGALSLNYEESAVMAGVDRSNFSAAIAVDGGDGGDPDNPNTPHDGTVITNPNEGNNPDVTPPGDGNNDSNPLQNNQGDNGTFTPDE